MADKFNCDSSPEDTFEVQEYCGIVHLYTVEKGRSATIHLSVEDAKALRKELKKIIKEIESNG